MGTIIERGTAVQIMPSMAVPAKYWYMLGTVKDYDKARDLNKVEVPGIGETWANAVDLCDRADFPEETKQDKEPIEGNVKEDPPVAVPGFITVTAAPQSFLLSFSEEKHVREMIDIRDILCVIEQDDGRAMIVRRSDENKPAVPLLVTVEDFDEVARRMRRAAECEK